MKYRGACTASAQGGATHVWELKGTRCSIVFGHSRHASRGVIPNGASLQFWTCVQTSMTNTAPLHTCRTAAERDATMSLQQMVQARTWQPA